MVFLWLYIRNRYGTEGRTLEQHFYSIINFTVK